MKSRKIAVLVAMVSVSVGSLLAAPSNAVVYKQVITAPTITGPAVVAMDVQGKCEASTDGAHFTPVKPGQIFTEGTIIRTGSKGRADLYFKRTGVAVRLQKDSELKLSKME